MGWPFDGKNPRKMARVMSTQWITLGVFILSLCIQQLNADDREITGTFCCCHLFNCRVNTSLQIDQQ